MTYPTNDKLKAADEWLARTLEKEEILLEDYERPLAPDNLKHFKPKVKILSFLLP